MATPYLRMAPALATDAATPQRWATVMIGFGALLPVLPLYIQEHGMDAGQLGLIVAAWSFAKLIFEPIFGWWADRHSRKPQMVAGLFLLAIVSLVPLFFTSFAAFVSLRFLAGVATAMYDPAARGMVVEATDEDERGEAFGYYGAFSTGGFVIGPALGAIGAWLFDGYAFPFIITFLLALVGTAVIALYLSPNPHVVESPEFAHHPDALPLPAGDPFTASEVAMSLPTPYQSVNKRRCGLSSTVGSSPPWCCRLACTSRLAPTR